MAHKKRIPFDGFEGDLGKRIKDARLRAHNIFYGIGTDLDDDILRLRVLLSRLYDYRIPIFDKYFDDRTIDELILEIELIKKSREPSEKSTSDLIKDTPNAKEEIAKELFGDQIKGTASNDNVIAHALKQRQSEISKTPPPPPLETEEKPSKDQWVDMPASKGDNTEMNEVMKEADKFMKSSKFKGESNDD